MVTYAKRNCDGSGSSLVSLILYGVSQLWSSPSIGSVKTKSHISQVLSWPANTDLVRRAVPALYNLSVKDIEAMADRWRYCAEQALHLADWAGTPQIRVLQTLCLLMNYQEGKAAYPAAGNTG